jgi:hypothetical protein
MASTYTLISSNVLSSAAASVTFSSIPQTYTDLVLRISSLTDDGMYYDQLDIKFNNSTTLRSSTNLYTNSSSVSSTRSTSTIQVFTDGDTLSTSNYGSAEFYIPNYTGSATKPLSGFGVSEYNSSTSVYVGVTAGLTRDTNPITRIDLTSGNAAQFYAGSSFYLYGIKNS